jgi:outer membrane biosynthesis protein TonB
MRAVTLTSRRRLALALLALLVAGVHAIVVTDFSDRLRAFAPEGSELARMDVAFVRELKPVDEPAPAAAPAPRAAAAPAPVARAASAPDAQAPPKPKPRKPPPVPPKPPDAAPPDKALARSPLEARAIDEGEAEPAPARAAADEPTAPKAAATPTTPTTTPTTTAGDAAVPAEASADAAAAAASAPSSSASTNASATSSTVAGTNFGWPPSTQLRYLLKGNYRGEVEGSAKVQWVRKGERYQVQLEVAIGPSFAPLMSRRMLSQGDLSSAGLVPRRYEERTRIGFSVRELAMSFDATRALLANGSSVPAPAGMQDASSQFVQLSYLFAMNPALLAPGRSVSFPVALPRRLDTWTYDVVGEEMLSTPIGELRTFHLRPRRESPRQGELVAQAWYAPSLQYLPVRILIHQDADSFIDMQLDGAPMQAEPSN